MPYAAPRFCPASGCAVLTDGSRCEAHRKARHVSVDARRKSPYQRGYDRAWQRLRKMKLAADPMCQIRTHCASKPLIYQIAVEVDHIIPIHDRPQLRLVWTNLQSSCHSCHSAKSLREMRERNGTTTSAEACLERPGRRIVFLNDINGLPPVPPNSCVREIRIGGGDED